jgi:hypothetical protein
MRDAKEEAMKNLTRLAVLTGVVFLGGGIAQAANISGNSHEDDHHE